QLLNHTGELLIKGSLETVLRYGYSGSWVALHIAFLTWSPPPGTYWVCGQKAFSSFSREGQGICCIGHIVPNLRITKELPQGHLRNKRTADQEAVETLAKLGQFSSILRGLLTPIGAFSNHQDIVLLASVLSVFLNETTGALSDIKQELAEFHQLSIQNRWASQGGVCTLINAEYCSFVEDKTVSLENYIKKLDKLQPALNNVFTGRNGFGSLFSWFSCWGWVQKLVSFLLSCTTLLTLICCCCKCL
uniref:ERVV2 protein n=1 Tax=Varanus komodoensis TaxID=61221 RepID=A0A8D2L4D2_VARKO